MREAPAHAWDLAACREEAFRLLALGVADRRSAFHAPALATTGLDGAPRLRTLVLRGFDAGARVVRLHCDARSGKMAELARDGRAALHVYDAAAQIQLRLRGRASLHRDDAAAAAAWEATRPFSRLVYGIEPAPGTPVAAPPAAPRHDARENFAVILLRFDVLEWLWLAADGHRRAIFAWNDDREEATWLVP
jgi:hypothetical protein